MTNSRLAAHPRSGELIALAKERDQESQERLRLLLEELGLPGDTFKAADEASVPSAGEVAIGSEVCRYLITDHVAEIDGAIPADLGSRLVAHSERLAGWSSGRRALTEGAYTGLYTRTVSAVMECARFYCCWNELATASSPFGLEVVRAGRGEPFGRRPRQDQQFEFFAFLNAGFDGGKLELLRPATPRLIDPELGRVVIVPSSFTHPCLVRPVNSGVMYFARGWLRP